MIDAIEWKHAAKSVPVEGIETHRVASPEQRRAVAEALGILGLDRLESRYRITHLPRGRFRLKGELRAHVVQACVVSLDPVAADLAEPFDLEFWPPEAVAAKAAKAQASDESGSGDLEALADDDPEPLTHNEIEAGRIIYETLATALDPYPRAPGAALDRLEAGAAGPEAGPPPTHPFAALAKLKRTND